MIRQQIVAMVLVNVQQLFLLAHLQRHVIAQPTVVMALVSVEPPVHVLVSVLDHFAILETMYVSAQPPLHLVLVSKQVNIVIHREIVVVEFANARHRSMLVPEHRLINVSVGHAIVEILEAIAVEILAVEVLALEV